MVTKKMKHKLQLVMLLMLLTSMSAKAQEKAIMDSKTQNAKAMRILKPAELPSNSGPKEYFTGNVKVTPLVQGEEPSSLTCGSVNFEAGARSAWHTHPKGQLLIVTEGAGLIQE